MCLVEAKVIGVMHMIDGGEIDDKIIAVAANDSSVNNINDLSDLPPHITMQVKRFFEDYKKLEHKDVVVNEFQGKEKAYEIILESIELYKKEFPTSSLWNITSNATNKDTNTCILATPKIDTTIELSVICEFLCLSFGNNFLER